MTWLRVTDHAIHAALPKVPLKRRYLCRVVAPTARVARELTVDIRGVEGLAAISDTAVHESGPAQSPPLVSQRLLLSRGSRSSA